MFRTISNDRYAATGVFRVSASGAFSQSATSFARLPDGGFLAIWSDVFFDTSSIRAQRFDSNGHKVGAEFQVTNNGIQSDVTMLPSGNLLITWVTQNPYPASFDIKARIYDASGAPVGQEFLVNTTTLNFQTEPAVSALAGGGFAIAWIEQDAGTFEEIRMQVFAADGTKVGGETVASDAQLGDKLIPQVLGLEGGGFVVGWFSFSGDTGPESGPGSRAQLFDAMGNKVGSPFAVNTPTSGSQQLRDWAALPGGGFIATWSDDGGPFTLNPHPENRGIWFQVFDASGAKVGSQVLASASGVSVQVPAIALLPDGFVIVWRDNTGTADNPNPHIRGQAFDLAGNKVGAEFAVTQGLNSSQHIPDVTGFGNGAFVVGWNNADGTQFTDDDVRAQLFFPVVHGSALADIFAGTPNRDFYIGHDGDDQISGQGDDDGLAGSGGNDILSGGDGNDDMDGGDGIDTLSGGAGNDLLDGGAGDDALTGGTGDDRYVVREAGDQVVEAAGEGLDTIVTSLADYSLPDNFENLTGDVAASAQQTLRGNALSNILTGAGLDTFYLGQGGTDIVNGGAGQDVLWILWNDSTANVTTTSLFNYNFNLIGGYDGSFTNGAAGSLTFTSIDVVNVWTGSGNDMIGAPRNGAQHDLRSGTGNDVVAIGRGVAFADGGEGNDGVQAEFSVFDAPVVWDLNAAGGYQSAYGSVVNFEYFWNLFTWTGNDIITTTALALNDTIRTWSGDDQIVVRNGHDIVEASAGSDLLTVEWSGLGGNVTMIDPIHFSFSGGWDGKMGTAAYSVTFVEVETFHVTTGSGDDNLVGASGDDRFTTGAGNDHLDGGAGADLLTGGAGNDVYVVGAGDTVVEAAGEGVDEIRTALASFSISGLANIENLTGTSGAGQTLTGNDLANSITGGSGNDLIDGGLGADTMAGGAGNDTYVGVEAGDTISEGTGQGVDEIRTGLAAYSLAALANVENLTGTAAGGQSLTGNGLANAIGGGDGDDVLIGGVGADTLTGGSGSDRLFSQAETPGFSYPYTGVSLDTAAEADALSGGAGDDFLFAGFGDSVDGGADWDSLYISFQGASAGVHADFREILTAGSTTIGGQTFTGIETIEYLEGSEHDDFLAPIGGGPGVPLFGPVYGRGGNDHIVASYYTGPIYGGDGNDLIDNSGGAYGFDLFGEAGDDTIVGGFGYEDIYGGDGNDNLNGASGFDTLYGGAGDDLLAGGDWNDTLHGEAGNDMLDGGIGDDTMAGGADNDLYHVDTNGDVVTELDGAGLDEVRTNLASFSLAGLAYVENLTGGSADQSLTGNGQNNIIDGGSGADAMAGGGGHDVYIVDNLGDTVTELDGAGTDEVRTNLGSKAPPERAVYVLPDFIENLTGTSAGAQGVRDNSLDNVIVMGNGHDLVVADAGGVDTVSGGAGNDFVYHGDKLTAADITNGGTGSDTVALLGNYGGGITFTAANLVGVERMALYTSLYLPGTGPNNYNITMNDANVAAGTEFFVTAASLQSNEVLTFNGAAETNGRFTVHGGGGADTIIGGAGGDFIIGNGGIDSLFGLGGVDFLIGGLGADQLRGGAGGDRYVYQSTAQSTTGSFDRILDFQHVDRIDLSTIDANGNAGDGNSAFTFIGSDAFHNVAGELRAYQSGGDWFVEGDVNGDGLADLVIQVTLPDATPLGVADFIL